MTAIGTLPQRLDITARVGSPITIAIPVLQADGTAAPIAGWTAQAQIRTPGVGIASTLLDTFGVVLATGLATITATATQTAAWETWASRFVPWDLVLTDTLGVPTPFRAGWVTVYPRISR